MPRRLAAALVCALAGVATPALAAAPPSLMSLLKEGPVVVVKHNAKGRFAACTGITHVHASVDAVWQVISHPGAWHTFMPKMERSHVEHAGKGWAMVTFELDVPGPDPEYTQRFDFDAKTHTVKVTWMRGDLKGTHTTWRVVPLSDHDVLLYETNDTEHYSGLAESLEDKQQTITIGVNVTAVLAGLKAVRVRAEAAGPARGAAKAP